MTDSILLAPAVLGEAVAADPAVPEALSPLAFAPVPVAPRADGWTPERQAGFIEALAASGCVAHAAAAAGMSRESAYRLRARPDAAAFRAAWDAAIDYAYHRLGEAAFDRALNGVPVPIFYRGEQVGERRHFDERLTQYLLRVRDPVRHAPHKERRTYFRETKIEATAAFFHRAVKALIGGGADTGKSRRTR